MNPIGWRTTRSELDNRLDEYFDGLHVSLWGRAYDLGQELSRQQAKDFAVKFLEDIQIVVIDEEISDEPLLGSSDTE